MAEALTVIEVALCITEVVERLCTFVSNVKGAKDDIRKLTQELLALKGALEHFHLQAETGLYASLETSVQSVLAMTQENLDAMQKKLGKPKTSKLGRAAQSLAWPFRMGDVEKYLAAAERAKTWFIMVLMKDSLDSTSTVLNEMQKLTAMLHEEVLARETDRMLTETDSLLKWLSPVDSEARLRDSVVDRVPGSGQWIHAGRFALWESGSRTAWPVFWITGRSGSGKTVLFSHLVEKLQGHIESNTTEKFSKLGLGFHCCSLDDAASQAVPNVFGSILAQIGTAKPEILQYVRPLRQSGNSLIPQNNLSIGNIHDLMDKALELYDVFYLMIDALNETSHEAVILKTLINLCERHRHLRVLLTCTREPALASPLIYVKQMNMGSVDLDIEKYVQHRFSTEHGFQVLSPKIKEEIRTRVVADACGTFRWAKLCMDRISTLRTGRDIRRVLSDIPSTLNETYAGILNRIPGQDKDIAREALTWLCFSLRPLRLVELAEAVVIEEGDTDIDGDSRLNDPAVVPQICLGLVHASKGVVTLAHDSIRTFLQSDWIRTSTASDFALDAAEAHRRIMRRCLTYLNLDPFISGPVHSLPQVDERFRNYPLLRYATFMWPIHSERFPLEKEDENLILDLFETKKLKNGGPFDAWVQFLLRDVDLNSIHNTQPLYYAASFNMTSILELILRPEHNVDVNKRGGRYSSPPLFVALWRRKEQAAKLLVKAGADPDKIDTSGQTSRDLALRAGMFDIIKLMDEVSPAKTPTRVASI
ncbi:hypothetical protein CkaCkLH20_07938 [Colletotrichum karsti]|uniref:Ankyrin repeat protein n=1 Tax=Colletotrichum karsti TaxID=1095194 RepID=A0A9P6LJ39_9PEZI|nr:uncharacterized protein CkaCkLH20_07938 [Colletotrichum karsti]KAF9874801.1 hypothetical protein CkaCkLH20_07938 [Colletotrichum karsti]